MRIDEITLHSGEATLHGRLFVPDRVPAQALLIFHGMHRGGFRWLPLYELLAARASEVGYLALLLDFRARGRSTGKFAYGYGEREDASEAMRYLASRPDVDRERIYALGHSLGGTTAAYALREDTRLKGFVLWATPPSHAYNVRKYVSRARGILGYYLFIALS